MAVAAWSEAETGSAILARSQVTAALKCSSTKFLTETAVFALAASGDIAGAGKLADELEQKYPRDTSVQNYIVPTVRAQNQLHQGRAAEAVQTLQKTLAMELSSAEVAQMEPT